MPRPRPGLQEGPPAPAPVRSTTWPPGAWGPGFRRPSLLCSFLNKRPIYFSILLLMGICVAETKITYFIQMIYLADYWVLQPAVVFPRRPTQTWEPQVLAWAPTLSPPVPSRTPRRAAPGAQTAQLRLVDRLAHLLSRIYPAR